MAGGYSGKADRMDRIFRIKFSLSSFGEEREKIVLWDVFPK
jgi:hypothetical protein